MQSSKLGFQVWLIAMYLVTTSLKGVSRMKLHRDLKVTQKTAWHLAHRLREMWKQDGTDPFHGPVEADEVYIGGKVRTMSNKRRKQFAGKGPSAGKVTVAGVRDRETKRVRAVVIDGETGPMTRGLVAGSTTTADAKLYTDESQNLRAPRAATRAGSESSPQAGRPGQSPHERHDSEGSLALDRKWSPGRMPLVAHVPVVQIRLIPRAYTGVVLGGDPVSGRHAARWSGR